MLRLIIISVAILMTDVAVGRYIDSLPEGITLHNVIQTWAEAQSQCASEDAVLASPINENVFKSMRSVIDVKNRTFYIGVKATGSNGHFVSVEGISIEDMTAAMVNMSPLLDPFDGGCLAMNSDSIHVVPCWSRLPYMCLTTGNKSSGTENATSAEENTTPTVEKTTLASNITVPEGGHMSNRFIEEGYIPYSSVQKFYKLHKEELEWDKAQEVCVAEGAQLATITKQSEAEFIKNMYDFKTHDWLLIGLRLRPGGWQSIQGQPVTELFNIWKFGYTPDTKRLSCGTLYKSGVLDDMYCDVTRPFVCQKDAIL